MSLYFNKNMSLMLFSTILRIIITLLCHCFSYIKMASKEAALEKCNGENGRPSVNGSSVKLRRELGLFSAINLILGVMIGSGIFVSPASALLHSGSVALCLIIWIVSGVISLLGGCR